MTPQAERICELAREAAEAGDAEIALRALSELRREVDVVVRLHAERALHAGRSFSDVARALGISRQAAHRRFRDLAPERPLPRRRPLVATDAACRVVRLAHAEAMAAGSPPGSEHVLLGILGTDSETTRALRFEGLTRERVRAHVGTVSERNGDGRASSSIRRIVKRAAQVALGRGDHELDVRPLLLAAVADADGGARRTLTALGVEPASLRAQLDGGRHR